jgi:Winged helix-turn-helix domain (DUF2582)
MTEVMFILITMYVLYVVYKYAIKKKQPYIYPSQPVPEQPIVPIIVSQEQPVVVAKPTMSQETPKKAKVAATKPVSATKGQTVPELVGMTAGNIWMYLDKNGSTTVAKLVRELPDDEKTIQRSIGWLAQEDKITLEVIDRAETISLKK